MEAVLLSIEYDETGGSFSSVGEMVPYNMSEVPSGKLNKYDFNSEIPPLKVRTAVDPVTFDPCVVESSSATEPPKRQTPEYVNLESLSSTIDEVALV